MRVLFVCTGNICRSPTAEGASEAGSGRRAAHRIEVGSAGTHDYHVGEAPDARSQTHARRRGYELSGLRARRFTREDFHAFDLILAMDREHHAILARLAPPSSGQKLRLMREFARRPGGDEVPDPYYGGPTASSWCSTSMRM
jgi:protein-tyrosine phosphatase